MCVCVCGKKYFFLIAKIKSLILSNLEDEKTCIANISMGTKVAGS